MSDKVHIQLITSSTCDKCKCTIHSRDLAILTHNRILHCCKCANVPKRLTVNETINLCSDASLRKRMHDFYRSQGLLDVYCDSLIEDRLFNSEILNLWKDVRGF